MEKEKIKGLPDEAIVESIISCAYSNGIGQIEKLKASIASKEEDAGQKGAEDELVLLKEELLHRLREAKYWEKRYAGLLKLQPIVPFRTSEK